MQPAPGIAGECCALLLCVHWDEMAVSVYLARGTLYYSRYDNSRVIVTEPSPSVLWPMCGLYTTVTRGGGSGS